MSRSTARSRAAGRPPTAASPRVEPTSPPTAIGVELSGSAVKLAVVTAAGDILATHQHTIRPKGRPEEAAATVAACVSDCLGEPAVTADALGLAVPGPVRHDGTMLWSTELPWLEAPLQSLVGRTTGLPTFATGVGAAVTTAEWRRGRGAGRRDLLCLHLGTSISGGVVTGGRPALGARSALGGFGHVPVLLNGRNCRCRNSGCLEAYVGGWAILERARELAAARPSASGQLREIAGGVEKISLASISEAVRTGDPLAQGLLEETVEFLASGVVGLINVLDPELLILGGNVIETFPSALRATEALIRQKAVEPVASGIEIAAARLGPDAAAVGAAILAHGRRDGGGSEG